MTRTNDAQCRFCATLGNPEWADDPRFATNAARRLASRDDLIQLIATRMRKFDSAHWLEILEAQSVPCSPINGMAEVFADPQVLHRNMKVPVPGAASDALVIVGSPLHLSETPVAYRSVLT